MIRIIYTNNRNKLPRVKRVTTLGEANKALLWVEAHGYKVIEVKGMAY